MASQKRKSGQRRHGRHPVGLARVAAGFPRRPRSPKRALINDAAAFERDYRRSIDEPEAFWAETAARGARLSKPWSKVLDWQPPWAKWFDGGELNVSENCLDRHLARAATSSPSSAEGEPLAESGGEPGGGQAHLSSASRRGVQAPRTRSRGSASRPATASRSTCP